MQLNQGTLDGFCGLYALTHLIGIRDEAEYDDVVRSTFFSLLRSLQNSGRLTAEKIAGPECGFTDIMISDAFNNMSAAKRHGLKTIPFGRSAFRKSRFCREARQVFEENCSLVILEGGITHWIAVAEISADGRYACYDPSVENPRQVRERIAWEQGLLVGPQDIIEGL